MSGRVHAPARVILLRHGVTIDGSVCQGARHDAPLAQIGRRQVHDALDRIGGVDRVVSSPSPRAHRGASVHAAQVAIDPRWAERDFGAWEGRPWSEVVDEVPTAARGGVSEYLAFTPDGGEAWGTVVARVATALEELADQGGTSLVVTHGGPIRAAVAHVLGIGLEHTLALRPDHGTSTWLARSGDDRAPGRGAWQLERFGW